MSDSDFSEQQLDSETVFSGKLLHVRRDRVRLPDGQEATREYVVHPGAAMIIAMPDPDTLVLERQFRDPLRRHFIDYLLKESPCKPDFIGRGTVCPCLRGTLLVGKTPGQGDLEAMK